MWQFIRAHYITYCVNVLVQASVVAAAHSGGFVATYILHCNALRIIPLLLSGVECCLLGSANEFRLRLYHRKFYYHILYNMI